MCAFGASFMRSNISLLIVANTSMPAILRLASSTTCTTASLCRPVVRKNFVPAKSRLILLNGCGFQTRRRYCCNHILFCTTSPSALHVADQTSLRVLAEVGCLVSLDLCSRVRRRKSSEVTTICDAYSISSVIRECRSCLRRHFSALSMADDLLHVVLGQLQ